MQPPAGVRTPPEPGWSRGPQVWLLSPQPSPAPPTRCTSPAAPPTRPTATGATAPASCTCLPLPPVPPEPQRGGHRSQNTPPLPCRVLQNAGPITEGCFCPEGMTLFSASKEVCVPTGCPRTSPRWAWGRRGVPSAGPGASCGCGSAVLPRRLDGGGRGCPAVTLISAPLGCLGPHGEPVEVSVGLWGAGLTLSARGSGEGQRGGHSVPAGQGALGPGGVWVLASPILTGTPPALLRGGGGAGHRCPPGASGTTSL